MSEQVQNKLVQLVKTQLEKKSSKKMEENFLKDETTKNKDDETKSKLQQQAQKQKMTRSRDQLEEGAKVAEEERWAMYRRLIIENFVRFFMIMLYCAVATIAVAKAGIIILSAFQEFLHGLFVLPTNDLTPKS